MQLFGLFGFQTAPSVLFRSWPLLQLRSSAFRIICCMLSKDIAELLRNILLLFCTSVVCPGANLKVIEHLLELRDFTLEHTDFGLV